MNPTEVRWEVEAFGDVQKVGYRDFVQGRARKLGLKGTVQNDKMNDRLVRIVVQGPEALLGDFLREISGKHGGIIDAEKVERVRESEPDPGLEDFLQLRGPHDEEMLERADQGAKYMGLFVESLQSLESLGEQSLSVSRESLSVGKETLAVRKETLSVSRESLSVGKETLAAVREGNRGLGGKIDGVARAVAIQGEQTSRLHHDLASAVRTMDRKYGTISKTLKGMQKDLRALARATEHHARVGEKQAAAMLRLAEQVARSSAHPARRSSAKR